MPPKFERALFLHKPPIPFETRDDHIIVFEWIANENNLHTWGFENAEKFRDYLKGAAGTTDARQVTSGANSYEFGPKR